MTKRTGSIESEVDVVPFTANQLAEEMINPHVRYAVTENGATRIEYDNALARLIASNIVTATDSGLAWRDGHLEHLAALYAADPSRTWRDYADDLTVAFAHEAGFAGMVEAARGE
jgi:Flp pilus assembly pilin Flp